MKYFLLGFISLISTAMGVSQNCPVAFTRNNGNTGGSCASHIKLDFTTCPSTTPLLDSIKINGVLEPETFTVYQTKCSGNSIYVDYCISDNNLPPASQITVYLTFPGATPTQNTNLVCNVSTPSGGPTPVILSAFNVQTVDDQVLVTWQTQQEFNSDAFQIERSTDGANFIQIGEVSAAGNSGVAHNYSFTDGTLTGSGTFYYRLKMVDIDGTYSYSTIHSISAGAPLNSYSVFPNPVPAGNKITIHNLTGPSVIRVFDLSGRMLNSFNASNTRQSEINIKEPGTYLIQITDMASGVTVVRRVSVLN
ncbi:MAG: T9SS type A sorting domain-containing protein [Bacteroidota bacterium]|nr:T9SS type A sorting domain-containing protein [Bacteroidota bacterium]